MPKKKKDSTLQTCLCCKFEATNVWNHVLNSYECKKYYFDNRQLQMPNVQIPQIGVKTTSKSSKNHIRPGCQPSSSHAMFGEYVALKSINPLMDNVLSHNVEIDNDNDIDYLSDDVLQDDNDNDMDEATNYSNDNSYFNIAQSQPSNKNNYTELSANMNQLISNSNFHPSALLSMKLFKILTKANAPLYLYNELNTFMKHSVPILASSNTSKLLKRGKLLSTLYSIIFNGSELAKSNHHRHLRYRFNLFPSLDSVQLSHSNVPAKVPTFNFKSLIVSLLLDPVIMQAHNLLMFDSSYQDPSTASHESYGDIHTGYWFQNAHKHLCKEKNDLLCPLIFFIDGVGLDAMQRQGLEPVTFTLGIFNRQARNSSQFWRILGYIPNLEKIEKFHYANQKQKLLKKEHYHEMLSHILSDVKMLQQEGGITWTFQNGQTYNLKFPMMYCIGDALGLDKLCNRKLHYSPTKTFMTGCCRDCNMVYKHCHDPQFVCQFHKSSVLNKLSDNLLDKMSFVPIPINAFDGMCFGNNERGLVGACPPEPLHQWYLGVVTVVMEYFWSRITNKAQDYLDIITRGLSRECHRQSDRDMPNISLFQLGLMREKLTGEERGNQLFMLYLAMLPTTVKSTIVAIDQESTSRKSIKNDKVYSKIINSYAKFDDWLMVFEHMLAISEWFKLDEIPKHDVEPSVDIVLKQNNVVFNPDMFKNDGIMNIDNNEIDHCYPNEGRNITIDEVINTTHLSEGPDDIVDVEHKISKVNSRMRNFMSLLLKVFHKDDHRMLQTLKNHHNLHYDANVCAFGSVPNYNGGCNEENMKSQVTNPSQLTQRRTSTLGYQTALRYTEKLIVDIGHNIALSTDQYKSSLFDGCTDYFSKLGQDHFHVNINKTCNSTPTTNNWLTSGYQRFTYDENYESDEDGDKQIEVSYTRTFYKNHKEITVMLLSDSFFNEVFMARIFHIMGAWNMFSDMSTTKHIVSFQTLKRDDFIFRCASNFYDKENNEWMDWVNVNWEYDDGSIQTLPAKILMFIDRDKSCKMNMTSINNIKHESPQCHLWAVVRSSKVDSSFTLREKQFHKCKLAKYFDLENEINIISCDSIHSPAYVLPDRDYSDNNDNVSNFGNIRRIIVIKKKEKWSQLFVNHT